MCIPAPLRIPCDELPLRPCQEGFQVPVDTRTRTAVPVDGSKFPFLIKPMNEAIPVGDLRRAFCRAFGFCFMLRPLLLPSEATDIVVYQELLRGRLTGPHPHP